MCCRIEYHINMVRVQRQVRFHPGRRGVYSSRPLRAENMHSKLERCSVHLQQEEGGRVHRTQPLAVHRCPMADILSTAEVDSVEPAWNPTLCHSTRTPTFPLWAV